MSDGETTERPVGPLRTPFDEVRLVQDARLIAGHDGKRFCDGVWVRSDTVESLLRLRWQ